MNQNPHQHSSRYEDTETVDWVQDTLEERARRIQHSRQIPISASSSASIKDTLHASFIDAQPWLIVLLVGVIIGTNAAVISIVTEWLSDFRLGHCSTNWWLNENFCCWETQDDQGTCPEWVPWTQYSLIQFLVYVFFAALFSFFASFLVKIYAPLAAGSGIGEIKCILAGFVIKGLLSLPVLIIKSITLPLAIASGLSVGKEGPSVHVASATGSVVANAFSQFRTSQARRREIITASSAAGVAVAFGSPIGGVLFSLEEMSHNYTIKTMWKSFFCALVATFTLSAINPFRTGKLVLFQVSYDRDWHFFELGFFMVIAIFGALYGSFVIKYHLKVQAFRRKFLSKYPIEEAVVLAVITAIIGYMNMFLRIDMTESLEILFRECERGGDYEDLCQSSAEWRMVNSLFLATFVRIIFVVLSYGTKVPAGIFVPSMAVGATFGRMVGILVKALHREYPDLAIFAACEKDTPCITPGAYALLGAASALAGVMRMTVTVVTIAFELTGQGAYILPTMFVVMLTNSIGDWFGKGGIADQMNSFNGYPILEAEDEYLNIPVSDVMTQDPVAFPSRGMKGDELEARLRVTPYKAFPIIKSWKDHHLLGFIKRQDLFRCLDDASERFPNLEDFECNFSFPDSDDTAQSSSSPQENSMDFSQYVIKTSLTVSPSHPLDFVMQIFKDIGPRVILVEKFGVLVGLVTIKDILKHQIIAEHRNDINTNGVPNGVVGELLAKFTTTLTKHYDGFFNRSSPNLSPDSSEFRTPQDQSPTPSNSVPMQNLSYQRGGQTHVLFDENEEEAEEESK